MRNAQGAAPELAPRANKASRSTRGGHEAASWAVFAFALASLRLCPTLLTQLTMVVPAPATAEPIRFVSAWKAFSALATSATLLELAFWALWAFGGVDPFAGTERVMDCAWHTRPRSKATTAAAKG